MTTINRKNGTPPSTHTTANTHSPPPSTNPTNTPTTGKSWHPTKPRFTPSSSTHANNAYTKRMEAINALNATKAKETELKEEKER